MGSAAAPVKYEKLELAAGPDAVPSNVVLEDVVERLGVTGGGGAAEDGTPDDGTSDGGGTGAAEDSGGAKEEAGADGIGGGAALDAGGSGAADGGNGAADSDGRVSSCAFTVIVAVSLTAGTLVTETMLPSVFVADVTSGPAIGSQALAPIGPPS